MNNSEKHYLNRSTGEVTESHAEANKWYRDGAQVEVWRNGRIILALLM